MRSLMRLWEEEFHNYQPNVRFEDHLNGTVSAIGGLYGRAADLALMGREIWPTEQLAFQQTIGFPASGVKVAMGSFDVPTKADALVVFVHRDNPLSCLTLEQLDGIFGSQHLRGGRNLRKWRDLGLGGTWAAQAIHPYGYRVDNAAAIFFRNRVMKGSLLWNPTLRQFGNRTGPGGHRTDSGRQILDALAGDRYGIAISNPHYAGQQVKAVSVSEDRGKGCVPATRSNVQNGSYPLARAVYIFFVHQPDHDVAPPVAEFLRYVLSAQGQEAVAREGAYLTLPVTVAARQSKILASFPSRPLTLHR